MNEGNGKAVSGARFHHVNMVGPGRLLLAFGVTSALLARAHAATSSWEYPSQEAGVHAMVYLGGGIFGLGLLLTLGLAVTACVFERRDGNRVGQLHADGEGYGGQHNQQQQQQQEFQQGQGQYGHHYGVVQDVQGKGQDAWGGGTWAQPPPKAPLQPPHHGSYAVPPLQQLQQVPAATQVVDFAAASANPRMWG